MATAHCPVGALLLALCVSALLGSPVVAHSPHDAIDVTAVTQDSAGQPIVFAACQFTGRPLLARSFNGGDSWTITALPTDDRYATEIVFSPEFLIDGTVFVSTIDRGIVKSTDQGASWAKLDDGGLDITVHDIAVLPTYPSDGVVLAATGSGVQRSTDGGLSWVSSTAGMGAAVALVLEASADTPGVVFAGAQAVFRSNDGGLSWTPLQLFESPIATIALSPTFALDSTLVLALENSGGVFTSIDGGTTWQPMTLGLSDPAVNDVAVASDGTVFAVSEQTALFRGALGGAFEIVGDGFEILSDLTTDHYQTVDLSPNYGQDGVVWVGGFEGLFLSEDEGQEFRPMDIYHQKFVRSIAFVEGAGSGERLYLQPYGGGLLTRSFVDLSDPPSLAEPATPSGADAMAQAGGSVSSGAPTGQSQTVEPAPFAPQTPWLSVSGSISALFGQRLALSPGFADDDTLFYGQAGLWRSYDRAKSWQQLALPPGVKVIRALSLSPDFVQDRIVFIGAGKEGNAYRSSDAGSSWTAMTTGLPAVTTPSDFAFSSAFSSDQLVYLSDKVSGMFVSTDGGSSWTSTSAGIDDLSLQALEMSPDFANDGTLIVGSKTMGAYMTNDGGLSWSVANVGLPRDTKLTVESIAFSPLFAVDRQVFMVVLQAGVFVSNDAGASWLAVGPGLPESAPRLVDLSPGYLTDQTLIVSTYDWVYRSQDGGASFAKLPGYARVDDGNNVLTYHLVNPPAESGAPGWPGVAWAAGALAGQVALSRDAGDFVSYSFVGDSVRWMATLGPDQGLARIVLDGEVVQTVDLYAPTPQPATSVFSANVPPGVGHQLMVINIGLANPAASDTVVRSDGFDSTF